MKFKSIIISLLLVTFFSCIAYANNESTILVQIDSCNENSITYSIIGTYEDDTVYAISALYKEKKMVDINMHPCSLKTENEPFTDTLTKDYDCIKVFLWDAETLRPLCKNASTDDSFTVTFKDDSDSVLSSETVKWGASCSLPQAPEKEGYIFKGWKGDYTNINQDTVITAEYIEESADNIFVVTGGSGSPGDLVTVSVDLKGTVNLCGFDMRLVYDKNCLEYVSLDSEFSFDLLANHVSSSNSIRFNFSSTKNRTQGGTVLQATFRIKEAATYDSTLKLLPIEVFKADTVVEGELINASHSVTEGVVLLNEE